MPVFITLLIAIAGIASNPISAAIENYEGIRSYQVTLISESGGTEETIRYFYKKPGFVKMEFVKPFRSAVLLYNPDTKKVKVTPFGSIKFLYFSLDPDNRLIKSSSGHRIDRSDLGELLQSVRELQENGKTEILSEENVNGKAAIRLSVKGEGDYTVDGIHTYELWLERETLLPLKVLSFDVEGKPIEEVHMDDLEINIVFPDKFFDL
jgi:outer membrane lipoprotein-sorting protein